MSPTTAAAYYPLPAMSSELPVWAYSAPGAPEAQTLPVFLAPPPPPALPAGYRMPPPPPPCPLAFRVPSTLLFQMDYRRSHSLVQFLRDEGAVPTPEEDMTREQVIRKLKKIVMDWAKQVGHEQRVPPRRVTATVLTYGSYTLGALLGFFAGIHLAILAAYICQKYPKATVNGLFTMFFEIFAHWHWQIPVDLHGQPSKCRLSDGCLMPIVMPCTPPELCASNMTESTFGKIREELMRGYALTKDLWKHDFEWTWLFEPFPYVTKYDQFLRIALCAPTSEELSDWAGWVKSRFRYLILKLEGDGIVCDPDPSPEVDHSVTMPNTVYYWGLVPQTNGYLDINSLKEDFMKDVVNDVYGKVKCTHSELTMSIVGSSELPKSMYGDSFYSQHLPRYMVGYQAATDCWSAVG